MMFPREFYYLVLCGSILLKKKKIYLQPRAHFLIRNTAFISHMIATFSLKAKETVLPYGESGI